MLHPAAPAYTIKGKKQTIDRLNDGYVDNSPGPMYNTAELGIKTRTLTFSNGKSSRTKINEGVLMTPSPTQYNNSMLNKGNSITIPKSQKINDQAKNQNPQAGIYQPDYTLEKVSYPNYSFGSKYPSIMDDTGVNPGPGQYQNAAKIPDSFLETKNSKFTSTRRFSQPTLRHPGVGDYKINEQKNKPSSKKGTISQANRFMDPNDNPGPGAYKTSQKFRENIEKKIGKTLGLRLEGCFTLKTETRDSFANYNRDDNPDFRKTFSFGKDKRQLFRNSDFPGPGDYKAEKPKKNTSRAFLVTANGVEYDTSRQNPGPGYYQSKQALQTKYSFGKSKSLQYLNTNPGAGRYELDKGMSKTRTKAWSVGRQKRTNFISKNTAGVGDYQILEKKTGGISIPRASRFPKPNNNPGPGDYQHQTTISNFNFYKKRTSSGSQTKI